MDRFHIIDEGAAILYSRGVYRQVKVYYKGADVYAGYGSGFIKLGMGSGTSVPNISYVGLEGDGIAATKGRKPTWEGVSQ